MDDMFNNYAHRCKSLSLKDSVVLYNGSRQVFHPSDMDMSLEHISLEPEAVSKGYILFQNQDADGVPMIDNDHDRQISVEIQVPEMIAPDTSLLPWDFNLLDSHRPPPVDPTPIPDPGNPMTKDEWLDLTHRTLDLLTEAVKKVPTIPISK